MAKNSNKKKLTKYEKWFRTLHRFYKAVVRPLFIHKQYGDAKPKNDRAYVIVCNHRSILDVFPAAVATDRPVHFIAKTDLWNKKMGKWFANKCECIPVNRDGTDVRAIMQAMKYLKNGENVGIFPEGTRNKTDATFLPFRGGAAMISIRTKTPIIPVIQYPKMRFLKRSYVYYGEPIEFAEYYGKKLTEEEYEICDEKLKEIMTQMYLELEEKFGKKKKRKEA